MLFCTLYLRISLATRETPPLCPTVSVLLFLNFSPNCPAVGYSAFPPYRLTFYKFGALFHIRLIRACCAQYRFAFEIFGEIYVLLPRHQIQIPSLWLTLSGKLSILLNISLLFLSEIEASMALIYAFKWCF